METPGIKPLQDEFEEESSKVPDALHQVAGAVAGGQQVGLWSAWVSNC